MAPYTTSSIPENPTLRTSKTLIVIPLLTKKYGPQNHSQESFKTLFSSLADLNLERHISGPRKTGRDKKEVTLIIPNASLTPPGEWRYDETSLKSHDFNFGCQRMMFIDGTRSSHAHDRLKAFKPPSTSTSSSEKGNGSDSNSKPSQYGEFIDLYPSRGISALIGVLNVKDCKSTEDLHEAETELNEWTHRFTPILHSQKYWDEAFESPMAPKNFIQKRLFVFDSFEDGNLIDLSESKANPGELVAFPPTENMDLHLNVVVQDLAVSTFMDLERRIRIMDGLGIEKSDPERAGKDSRPSGIQDIANIVGDSNTEFNEMLNTNEDQEEESNGIGNSNSNSNSDTEKGKESKSETSSGANGSGDGKDSKHNKGGVGRIRAIRGLVKALNNRNALVNDACAVLPPIEHELQTPIDVSFDEAKLTGKDIDTIFKRNSARREKYTGDLALLAGSAMDAYDRYTKAAEVSKLAHDPLWYAAALEGIAMSFVAMSDTGGHGADFYLENNFQYPDEIMSSAISIIGNVESGNDTTTKVDRSKTTMPRAIYALLEEAYGIYSRNVKLSSLASELLLKIAWYTAELEGLHLRCRWGEGFSGADDQEDSEDHTMTAAINGSQKRWEMTSVSKLDLGLLRQRQKLDPVLSKSASSQCQRFVATMHRAVSNSGLDSYTRSCVAARCAQLCVKGLRGPYWGSLDGKHVDKRFKLPRKAAFFTTIAAETMSQCIASGAQTCAIGFWVAASHFYSKERNKFSSDDKYAWACLRTTVFHAMSLHGGGISSEKAIEKLLLLLGSCSSKAGSSATELQQEPFKFNEEKASDVEKDDSFDKVRDTEMIPKQGHSRSKSSTSSGRSYLFTQTSSQVMNEQYKWVDDNEVPPILLPLVEPSSKVVIYGEDGSIRFMKKMPKSYNVSPPLISLNAVITEMDVNVCIDAQKQCITVLSQLRKRIPTISPCGVLEGASIPASDKSYKSNENPLTIVSAKIMKSQAHLLDKLKAAGYSGKEKGSLATFFNPFANKKKEASGEKMTTLVAQGEERMIMVEFNNCLAVSLNIPNCQLVFDKSRSVDIEAPHLSFTLPAQTSKFAVYFPFTVASLHENKSFELSDAVAADDKENEFQSMFTFGAIGVRVSTSNRSFFVPFLNFGNFPHPAPSYQVPNPTFIYNANRNKANKTNGGLHVGLEAVPAQPNLLVSFANSPTPLEEAVTIPVHLSDGEIFTIPPFRLENDFGSSGRGQLERLQIAAVGLPGLPEEILFDTDEVAKALEQQEETFSDEESENDDFEELMESDGLPPLKMKCLADGLSLARINDESKSLGQGTQLSFQVAATHDMGKKIINGGNVRIRFRYRGPSPTSGTEIWRKREVALKIVKVKGPRISSLTFRSDLSWGSAYSDLCYALANQRKKTSGLEPTATMRHNFHKNNRSNACVLGKSDGIFITNDDIVVLMAVANETNSTIILSNRTGNVGGFESSPIPTVKVSSGVSVKIPMVIPCIDNVDNDREAFDIVNELVTQTALKWESEVIDTNDSTHKGSRQGRVRIPVRCLREMIQEHESFSTRICRSPITVRLKVNGMENSVEELVTHVGTPLNLSMFCRAEDYISKQNLVASISMEFCCSRKNSGKSSSKFLVDNKGAYIWCGQVQKTFPFEQSGVQHHTKLCFLDQGHFVISACVRLNNETWLAPSYWNVHVQKKKK